MNAAIPIHVPSLGLAPLRLSVWFAETGESVYQGDRLVEVSSGAATFDVAAPATGRLASQLLMPRDALEPGQVLGFVEADPPE